MSTARTGRDGIARVRLWLVVATVLVVANVFMQVVRVTDIGAPEGAVSSTIDPCSLLSRDVIDAVLPDAAVDTRSDRTVGGRAWLEPSMEFGSCVLGGRGAVIGTLAVVVFRYRGHQFHLGPGGESKAQQRYEETVANRMDALGRDCAYAMRTDHGEACGFLRNAGAFPDGLTLHLRAHNVYVEVTTSPMTGVDTPRPRQAVMSILTQEILGKLGALPAGHPAGAPS